VRNLLEPALLFAHALEHFDTAAEQTRRDEELVVGADEGHRADLGQPRLDEPNGLEHGRRAQDSDGVAAADVVRVDCQVAVRRVEQRGRGGRVEELCCAHLGVGREVRREDGYVGYLRSSRHAGGERCDGVLRDRVPHLSDSEDAAICTTAHRVSWGLS
jgi:hypothetical protein